MFLPFAPLGEKVAAGRMRGHEARLDEKTFIRLSHKRRHTATVA
jgi:hypothetical protein